MDFTVMLAHERMINELYALELESWGKDGSASPEMMRARIATNQHGNFVAVDSNGRICGSVWTNFIAEKAVTTWSESTGNGKYTNYDPNGEIVFGVNLSARRNEHQGAVGMLLLKRAVKLVIDLHKKCGWLGARMPDYNLWQAVFDPHHYVHLYRHGSRVYFCDPVSGKVYFGGMMLSFSRLRRIGNAEKVHPHSWKQIENLPEGATCFDHELAFFCSCVVDGVPFRVRKLLPGYFPDPESCDNGALLEWRNPYF